MTVTTENGRVGWVDVRYDEDGTWVVEFDGEKWRFPPRMCWSPGIAAEKAVRGSYSSEGLSAVIDSTETHEDIVADKWSVKVLYHVL